MFLRNLFVAALAAGAALAVPLTKADASLEARGGGAWFHSAANENEFFDEKSTSKRDLKALAFSQAALDYALTAGGGWEVASPAMVPPLVGVLGVCLLGF
ncbi:hypothetical protein AB5N19_10164 [Seiridium cardinale]